VPARRWLKISNFCQRNADKNC